MKTDLGVNPLVTLDDTGGGQAKFYTLPNPDARHDLKAIKATAEALGTPLMPWQEQVARVASERSTEDPSRFRYPIVVLTVPRQSGKTTLMRAVLAQRAITMKNRTAFYTAQSGKDARERWLDLVSAFETSIFTQYVHKRIAAGSSALTVLPTGSKISPFAPTEKSLHGYTPHDVFLDEIFVWDMEHGQALMGAIKPAQITLASRQIWLVSTRGTRESAFLDHWIEAGRAAVGDPSAGVAYFEWSMPEGRDPYDPESWDFHPALGYTITKADLAESAESLSAGEWLRAYMNLPSETEETWLDMKRYDDLTDHDLAAPAWKDVVVSYEADPHGRWGSIMATWKRADGKPVCKPVKSAPGIHWITGEVKKIRETHKPRGIWADDAGATRVITEELVRDGVKVQTLGARDFATSCASWKKGIEQGTVHMAESPAMRTAFTRAVTRPMAEGYTLSRKASPDPISEAIAAIVGHRAIESARAQVKPQIRG